MTEFNNYERIINDLSTELKSLSETYYLKMNTNDCEKYFKDVETILIKHNRTSESLEKQYQTLYSIIEKMNKFFNDRDAKSTK